MTDQSSGGDARRVSPLAAVRRAWPLALVITFLGLLLGLSVASTHRVTYSAESRVAVGTGSLSASAVAGYTVGVVSIAADYARSVTTDDAVARLRTTFGSEADGVLAVNASPLPDSAVIRVDVEATSKGLALRATAAVTTSFIDSINAQVRSVSPASVLTQFRATQTRLVAAQAVQGNDQATLDSLRAQGFGPTSAQVVAATRTVQADTVSVSTLNTQATALNVQYQTLVSAPPAENGLRTVQAATSIGSDQPSIFERYGLLGIAVGALAALVVATWRDRRRVDRAVAAAPSAPSRAALGRRAREPRAARPDDAHPDPAGGRRPAESAAGGRPRAGRRPLPARGAAVRAGTPDPAAGGGARARSGDAATGRAGCGRPGRPRSRRRASGHPRSGRLGGAGQRVDRRHPPVVGAGHDDGLRAGRRTGEPPGGCGRGGRAGGPGRLLRAPDVRGGADLRGGGAAGPPAPAPDRGEGRGRGRDAGHPRAGRRRRCGVRGHGGDGAASGRERSGRGVTRFRRGRVRHSGVRRGRVRRGRVRRPGSRRIDRGGPG